MFDHGTASTARARTEIEAICTARPITVMMSDQRPMRSARARLARDSAGGSPLSRTGGPPAPTSSRAGAAASSAGVRPTRPKAYSAVKPTMASA